MYHDSQLGFVSFSDVKDVGSDIFGGLFVKGRCDPKLPGFTATMCRHPTHHFFKDRLGWEYEWISEEGGPPYKLGHGYFGTAGLNLSPPFGMSNDPRLPGNPEHDLTNLIQYGSIYAPSEPAARPTEGANGQYPKAEPMKAGMQNILPLLLIGGVALTLMRK